MIIPELGPIRQDDFGTPITLTIKNPDGSSITDAPTSATMTFRRPDAQTHFTRPATSFGIVDGNLKVSYTLAAGDIDKHGKYPVQVKAVWSNGTWRTSEASLTVARDLEAVDGE